MLTPEELVGLALADRWPSVEMLVAAGVTPEVLAVVVDMMKLDLSIERSMVTQAARDLSDAVLRFLEGP